jgi:hypothetical protein
MIPQDVLFQLFGDLYEIRSYPEQIPEKLKPWHIYLPDAGHSIVAVLEQNAPSIEQGDYINYLLPVPVKSVLKNYSVQNGIVVAASTDLHYSLEVGLISPESDSEY